MTSIPEIHKLSVYWKMMEVSEIGGYSMNFSIEGTDPRYIAWLYGKSRRECGMYSGWYGNEYENEVIRNMGLWVWLTAVAAWKPDSNFEELRDERVPFFEAGARLEPMPEIEDKRTEDISYETYTRMTSLRRTLGDDTLPPPYKPKE